MKNLNITFGISAGIQHSSMTGYMESGKFQQSFSIGFIVNKRKHILNIRLPYVANKYLKYSFGGMRLIPLTFKPQK